MEPSLAGHHGEVFAKLVASEDINGIQFFAVKQGFAGVIEFTGKTRSVVIAEFLIRVGSGDQFGATSASKFFEVAPDVVVMKAESGDTVHGSVW